MPHVPSWQRRPITPPPNQCRYSRDTHRTALMGWTQQHWESRSLRVQLDFIGGPGSFAEHRRHRAVFFFGKTDSILRWLSRHLTRTPVEQLDSDINARRLRGL